MQPVSLNDLQQGQSYYVQFMGRRFSVIYDRYDSQHFHFKDIISLNQGWPQWSGTIFIYDYMKYKIFQVNKHAIQAQMETRALSKILESVTGQSGL